MLVFFHVSMAHCNIETWIPKNRMLRTKARAFKGLRGVKGLRSVMGLRKGY